MPFGVETDEQASHRQLDRFVEAGGNFVDTADVYGSQGPGPGASEEIIGKWLAGRSRDQRDQLVIATKAFQRMGHGPNDDGAGRKHLTGAIEASLRRLGTDYIDLYQVHYYDDATPVEETLSTLDGLVRSGKVRYVGASNYASWQLQKAVDLSRHHGWERFVSLQPRYNVLDREVELELEPVCRNEGLGMIPFHPLRGGWFTGKYRRGMDGPPRGTRWGDLSGASWFDWQRLADERAWSVTDSVLAVAEESGRSPAQVALRWLLQRPGVTAPIIGARRLEQLDDNLGAVGWSLEDAQLERITSAGHRPPPYPHDVLPNFSRR
jgi:aryl-alcohol dehydrogenase-like predicted oxidoreductase